MKAIVILIGLLLPATALASAGEGPNWTKLGLHAANLLILILVLKLAAGKMIKGAVASRAKRIQMHLEESNKMRADAQNRFDELEARLSHMEKEVDTMREEAVVSAEREAELIRKQADADVKRIQEAAEHTIKNETEAARRALRKDAVELALRIAEEKLKSTVSQKEQDALAKDFLGSLKEANGNG
jgi:F-type H+-transporting ATPase subunit b